MKSTFSLVLITLILFCKIPFAQISLEHAYADAGPGNSLFGNQLIIVHFEDAGQHYVTIDRQNHQILIYDLNHTLIQTLSVPALTMGVVKYVLYLSQKLFDLDEGIEYMLVLNDWVNGHTPATYIFDEDGSALFSRANQLPTVLLSIPEQQFPIYNTPNGTKMILSSWINDSAYVYSLPGTLSTAIGETNNNYISNLSANKIFPNPASSQANIELQLSTSDLPAILKVFDLSGNKITEQKILAATNSIAINTLGLPAGIYYYEIENSEQVLAGEKFVVAH